MRGERGVRTLPMRCAAVLTRGRNSLHCVHTSDRPLALPISRSNFARPTRLCSVASLLYSRMSTKGSHKKKAKSPASGPVAAAAPALDDIDMSESSDSLGEFVPSTKIGSYLSQNYNVELESKKVPGFICGRQWQGERAGEARCELMPAACSGRGRIADLVVFPVVALRRMLLSELAQGA